MKTVMTAVRLLMALTLLTGLIYPWAMTGLAGLLFPDESSGSLVHAGDRVVGSSLVGQSFSTGRFFWSRPSAVGYNPMPSGGTNLGPTSAVLRDSVQARAARLGAAVSDIPADLLTTSGSGLDPEISPEAALFQVDRVLKGRGYGPERDAAVRELIGRLTVPPTLGFLGEPRVNVLQLNLALDSLLP